jgi:hypothetical protein
MEIERSGLGIVYSAIQALCSQTRQKALHPLLCPDPERQHGRCPLSADIQMCRFIQPETIQRILAIQA